MEKDRRGLVGEDNRKGRRESVRRSPAAEEARKGPNVQGASVVMSRSRRYPYRTGAASSVRGMIGW